MTTFSPGTPRLGALSSSRANERAEILGRRESQAVWGGFAAIAAAALAFLMWRGAGNTFFYDDWSWILGRGGLHWVLASYNEHLQIAPKAIYLLLFHTVGISQYWEYRLLSALAHLACVAAIFAYALRRLGPMALLIAIPIAVFGAGSEFILWGNVFGFPASMALSVAALLWLDHDDRRGDVMACVLLTLGLLFSETALLFAAGVAVELTWRERSLRRAWVWAIPAALYAAWWVAYYQPYLREHDYGAIPSFIAKMAVHAAGGLFGLGATGGAAVLVVVLAGLAFLVLRRGALNPRLLGLGVTLVIFWCLVAVTRAELNQPGASRYVYTGSLVLVLILVEAFRGVGRAPKAMLAVGILSALSLIGNVRAFGPEEAWLHTDSRTVAAELGALDVARSTASPGLVLDPVYGPQVIAGPYFAAVRDLGSTPADSPAQILHSPESMRVAADDVLIRAGAIRVRRAPAGTALARIPPTGGDARDGRGSALRGCARLSPVGPGSAFDLELPAAGLELRPVAQPGAGGAPAVVRVKRFASGYRNPPVATLRGSAALLVQATRDPDPRPWQLRIWSPRHAGRSVHSYIEGVAVRAA